MNRILKHYPCNRLSRPNLPKRSPASPKSRPACRSVLRDMAYALRLSLSLKDLISSASRRGGRLAATRREARKLRPPSGRGYNGFYVTPFKIIVAKFLDEIAARIRSCSDWTTV